VGQFQSVCYEAAEQRLVPLLSRHPPVVAALDLLARIRAQQGRLSEAERCWQQALQLDRENTVYGAGLRRVAQLRRQAVHLFVFAPPLLGLVGLLLLLLALNLLLS
jgi:tetratricopeptide (TPR) repeat protein